MGVLWCKILLIVLRINHLHNKQWVLFSQLMLGDLVQRFLSLDVLVNIMSARAFSNTKYEVQF